MKKTKRTSMEKPKEVYATTMSPNPSPSLLTTSRRRRTLRPSFGRTRAGQAGVSDDCFLLLPYPLAL